MFAFTRKLTTNRQKSLSGLFLRNLYDSFWVYLIGEFNSRIIKRCSVYFWKYEVFRSGSKKRQMSRSALRRINGAIYCPWRWSYRTDLPSSMLTLNSSSILTIQFSRLMWWWCLARCGSLQACAPSTWKTGKKIPITIHLVFFKNHLINQLLSSLISCLCPLICRSTKRDSSACRK